MKDREKRGNNDDHDDGIDNEDERKYIDDEDDEDSVSDEGIWRANAECVASLYTEIDRRLITRYSLDPQEEAGGRA